MTISIHSPHTGRDMGQPNALRCTRIYFNPLSPHGERRDYLPQQIF